MSTILRAVIDGSGLSRRKAFDAIRQGYVTLDGAVVVDPSREHGGEELRLDGQVLAASPGKPVYLMLNKPPGFVTTRSDERGRPTVFDLVPESLRAPGLHSVGRLDLDTSGLLLLTNDGDFTFRLTHPSNEVEKEYWAGLATPAYDHLIEALHQGIELDGRRRRPMDVVRLSGQEPFQVSVTISEGRKRQVRLMFAALGARIRQLRRVREGPLTLSGLAEGKVRSLTRDEIELLKGPSS